MSGYSFDSNIVIDALLGIQVGRDEIDRARSGGSRVWISRMVWIEVLSKGTADTVREAEFFLAGFGIDEVDVETSRRAAALRRERQRLRASDAVILASAQVHGRILVTRNTKDFPASLPGIRIPYTLQP